MVCGTIVRIEDTSGVISFWVEFDGGQEGERLSFCLTDVTGFNYNRYPGSYRAFGPYGLVEGVRVLCEVDASDPPGVIRFVEPAPAVAQAAFAD